MIYLFRHGQTDWNLFKRANGSTDTYLNQTGIAQAEAQIENLKDIHFDVCFCSSLTRARRFCEIIFNGQIELDDRLTEIDCGEFEGMEETAEMMKSFWQAIKTGKKGTERLDRFIKRNCDFCDLISNSYKSKNVLIVTHAANARVIDYYYTGKPEDYDFSKTVIEKGEFITYDNSAVD